MYFSLNWLCRSFRSARERSMCPRLPADCSQSLISLKERSLGAEFEEAAFL